VTSRTLTPMLAAAQRREPGRQAVSAADSRGSAVDPPESVTGADGSPNAVMLVWDLTVHGCTGQALPVGPVVEAYQPVPAAPADQDAIRRVATAAFAPSRVLLIDTVRAAAIRSGAATEMLLVADVGAQLTEVAVLVDSRVAAAREVIVVGDRAHHAGADDPAGREPAGARATGPASPRLAALSGAGLAATAACRHHATAAA
jgi:hypothetical protein